MNEKICIICGSDAAIEIRNKPVCMKCISEMVKEYQDSLKKPEVPKIINDIVSKVQDFTGIEDITFRTRKREICEARQIAHYLSKEHTNESLASIGWKIGAMDHATVLHSHKTISNLLSDKLFRKKYIDLIEYFE